MRPRKQNKEYTLYSSVLIFQIIYYNLFYETVSESIEWIIEVEDIGSYPTIFPPSTVLSVSSTNDKQED
jgi:hypothetical protein